MSFLRWLALVALAFWIGGLVVLGAVAAPLLFAVLQQHDPVGGRELAAATFGVIFERFQLFAGLAGIFLLISIGFRAALGPRPRRFGVRMWVAALMLAGCLFTVLVITPRVRAIAASVSGPVASLPSDDARRLAFGRWHGVSSGLMLVTIVAGVALLWAETRDE